MAPTVGAMALLLSSQAYHTSADVGLLLTAGEQRVHSKVAGPAQKWEHLPKATSPILRLLRRTGRPSLRWVRLSLMAYSHLLK